MSLVPQAWIETAGVVGLAVAGAAAGRWCSVWRKPWWLTGYVVSLLLLVVIGMARWFPQLESCPPFAWVMAGRLEFALLAPVFAMLLTILSSRLPRKREAILFALLMVVCTIVCSVLPFLLPALNYRYLAELKTMVDTDGGLHPEQRVYVRSGRGGHGLEETRCEGRGRRVGDSRPYDSGGRYADGQPVFGYSQGIRGGLPASLLSDG